MSSQTPLFRHTSNGNKSLEELFATDYASEHHFNDDECRLISSQLSADQHDNWAAIPRLYIVLRLINQIHLIDDFLRLGLNDYCLPFNGTSSFPSSLPFRSRQSFLDKQSLVLTKSIAIEKGLSNKGHVRFSKEDPFPYEELGHLGCGRSGLVDKVKSPLKGDVLARKRFHKVRGVPQDTVRVFMNELQVLKRIEHEHCVELVCLYPPPQEI